MPESRLTGHSARWAKVGRLGRLPERLLSGAPLISAARHLACGSRRHQTPYACFVLAAFACCVAWWTGFRATAGANGLWGAGGVVVGGAAGLARLASERVNRRVNR